MNITRMSPEDKVITGPNKPTLDNPAAALVTQVPQGATKPVVDPT